jgi:dienelactone hydrolase
MMSRTTDTESPITGRAAGVPFVAVPPESGDPASAPVVVAWHLLDPPRTEAAFAAAVPLRDLEAWRIYLGLPMSGSRLPSGGLDELMRLGYEDAVLKLDKPIVYTAVEEFPPAFRALRDRLGFQTQRVGAMGGSVGAAVAQLLLAEGDQPIGAAVLISPVVQLRRAVDAMARRYGVTYPWSKEANAVADRLDFIARAAEIAGRHNQPPILLVVGEEDDPALREPAAQLRTALAEQYQDDARVQLITVPGMAHALADEPGTEPASQTPHAKMVDQHAGSWFRRHLGNSGEAR